MGTPVLGSVSSVTFAPASASPRSPCSGPNRAVSLILGLAWRMSMRWVSPTMAV